MSDRLIRNGRLAVVILSCLAALPCAMWLAGLLDLPPVGSVSLFGPVAMLFRVVEKSPELAYLLPVFYHLASVTGLLTCALASVLSIRAHRVADARSLATGLAGLSIGLSWLYYYRVFPRFAIDTESHFTAVADLAALLAFGLGTFRMVGFFASYPKKIDVSAARELENRRGIVLDDIPGVAGRFASFISRQLKPMERFEYGSGLMWKQIATALLATAFAHGFRGNYFLGVIMPFALVVSSASMDFGACWTALSYNYRHALAETRRAIEWIYGALWFTAVTLLTAILAFVPVVFLLPREVLRQIAGPFLTLAPVAYFLLFIVAVGVSIFYRGTIDPTLAIRRTSVYGLLGLLMSVLFISLERLLAGEVASAVGLSDRSGATIAGISTALLFIPAYRWLDGKISSAISRVLPATHLAEGLPKQAVVAFCDLSGFTALSVADQRAALTLAGLFHREARKVASEFGGRVVKTIGDAVMLEFRDASQGLHAVRQLHERFGTDSRELGLPAMAVHSGLNAGEVVQALDGDLYGATVNLAARLQGEAGDDEIVTTAQVRAAFEGGPVSFVPLGPKHFKNVPDAVDCFRMARVGQALAPQERPRR